MSKKRPINLNLWTIRFPITAIASILHRLSGALLFFLIPGLLWLWDTSLRGPSGFSYVTKLFSHPLSKLGLFLILLFLCYHLFAGVRHLVMDFGKGMELQQARRSAGLVMVLAVLSVLCLGLWLW